MKKLLLSNVLALVACLLCSMSAVAQEAYVCITTADSTMTFYYDDLRASRPGTTYVISPYGNSTAWYHNGYCPSIAQVVFDPSFANHRPRTTSYWFDNMKNLRTITGMEYLNTSETVSMY